MKRVLLVLLLLVFSVTLAFAGSEKEAVEESGSAQQAVTELHFYSIDTNPDQSINKHIAGFEAENPQYKVTYHGFERARYDEAVRTAVTGGEPIDILLLDGQFVVAYKNDGLIYPAEDYVDFKDRYAQGVLDAITHDGKTWGIPWQSSVMCYWLNDPIFKKYDLPDPETWDDLITIRDKLEGTGIAPMVYPCSQVWWVPALMFSTLPDYVDNDPIGFTKRTLRGEFGYDDPAYIKAFDRVQKFVTEDIFMKGSLGIDYDAAIQLFVQGKAAMFYMGNWALPTINSAAPDVNDIRTHWVPHMPGMKPQPAGGPGFCYTISKQTKNLDGAAAFVEYLSRDENAYITSVGAGYDTANLVSDKKYADEVNDPLRASIVPYYENVAVFLDWLWEPEITQEFKIQMQALIAEKITPQECGENIQKKFVELKREGRTYYWK